MIIKQIMFARPVPLPADAAATHLAVDDNRYTSVGAELKNNGVQLAIVDKAGKPMAVYVPLANVTCIHGDDAPAAKGK